MFSVKWQYIYCILKMFMMSVYEKKIGRSMAY